MQGTDEFEGIFLDQQTGAAPEVESQQGVAEGVGVVLFLKQNVGKPALDKVALEIVPGTHADDMVGKSGGALETHLPAVGLIGVAGKNAESLDQVGVDGETEPDLDIPGSNAKD